MSFFFFFFLNYDFWYYWGTACLCTWYHQGIAGLNCNHVLAVAFLHHSFVTATNKSQRKSLLLSFFFLDPLLLLSLLQSNSWRRIFFHFFLYFILQFIPFYRSIFYASSKSTWNNRENIESSVWEVATKGKTFHLLNVAVGA